MDIKVTKQTDTGLNIEFKNADTGYRFTLDHAINQINNGNPSFKDYHTVDRGGVTYIRSNPDSKRNNNIED